jgi:hypothetical protein
VFACASCLLLGAGVPSTRAERPLTRVLPVVIAFAFLLIADIDSPRRGVIRVTPDNLQSIASMFETR